MRGVWRIAKLYWKTLSSFWKTLSSFVVSFASFVAGVASVVALLWIAALLVHEITQPSLTISGIAVPEDLTKRGFASIVVANRLRDALNHFSRATSTTMKRSELSLPGDTPEVVVPALGLPLTAIVTTTSRVLHLSNHSDLSGELTLSNNQLWLRLRLNDLVIFENASGVAANTPDRLFRSAARAVFEYHQPFIVASRLFEAYKHAGIPNPALDEASSIIARLPETDENVSRSYNLRGMIFDAHHRLDLAIPDYQTAMRLAPKDPNPHNNLGNLLKDEGKLNMAASEYQTAIGLDPNYALPHNNLGSIWYDEGKLNMAAREYQTAIGLDPNYALPHNNLGSIWYDEGKRDQAATEYQTAMRLDPKSADPHTGLGNVWYAKGKRDQAATEYQTAIRLDPKSADPHTGLGNVWYAKGKRDQAAAEYREAERLRSSGASHR